MARSMVYVYVAAVIAAISTNRRFGPGRVYHIMNVRGAQLKAPAWPLSNVGRSARWVFAFLLAGLIGPVLGQTPPEQTAKLPSQAKSVEGVLVPVPNEIFHSLDQFHGANWRAAKRPEVLKWKSQGHQVQIALLLGVVVAEGFIAMEAEDARKIREIGNRVLALARGLGVEKAALRRSRSIVEHAEKSEWGAARQEWDAVLSDLEAGLINLKSEHLSQLVSLGGWLRGTEALSVLVLQNYSAERAQLIRQPAMLDHLKRQLKRMNPTVRNDPRVAAMADGLGRIQSLTPADNAVVEERTVKEIRTLCQELVLVVSTGSG